VRGGAFRTQSASDEGAKSEAFRIGLFRGGGCPTEAEWQPWAVPRFQLQIYPPAGPLSQIFCLMCFPILQRPGAKVARSHNVGGKPQWDGVKHIQDLSIVCGSVSIAFGMNETHMDESKDCPRNGRAAPAAL
jgi:hypothetical protein